MRFAGSPALAAAHECLATTEAALADTHEALAAVTRELAIVATTSSTPPDASITVQSRPPSGWAGPGHRRRDAPPQRHRLVKIGGARRVSRADLERYLESLRASA